MIYELSYKGYRLGMFPTEAEAVRRADLPPEWMLHGSGMVDEGEFMTFDPSTNKRYDFDNKQ